MRLRSQTGSSVPGSSSTPREGPSPEVLDFAALRRNFDDDWEFLGRLLQKFEASYPRQVARIREALLSGDGHAAAEEAHRVAGATSVFFAEAARRTALALEDVARAGDLARASDACETLAAELDRLVAELRTLATSR